MDSSSTIHRGPPTRAHSAVPHRRAGTPPGLVAIGMVVLGRWVRDARVMAGMTQAQLARLAGMHQTTLSRLECGKLEGLRLHRLAALIGVLESIGGSPIPPMIS